MDRTYYDVLGVSPDASPEELADARERRVMALSEKGLRPAPEHEAVASALLRQLDQAFSVLDDEESRQAYDTALETGVPLEQELLDEVDARFQEQFAATVGQIGARVEGYVRALAPDVDWRVEEACAPWDVVLEGKDGEVLRTVSVKFLPDLHPGDMVGTIESAESQLASCAQDVPQTHAFFLLSGLLLEGGRLFTLAEEFNQASWVSRDPSSPRAFLAYTDLDGNLTVIPAVDEPVPDLAQVCGAVDIEDLPEDLRPTGPERPAPAPSPESPPQAEAAPSTVTSASTGMRIPPPPPRTQDTQVAEGGAVPSSSPGQEATGTSDDESFHVLVVDDERLPFQMIKKALAGEPYELHHTQNWLDSRDFLNEEDCAVMILDLSMPSIGGDKLALFVHSHPDIQPKPRIVIHSGLAQEELRRISSRIGAHACLQKGCGPEAIRQAVRSGVRAYTRDQLLMGPW
jgi:CheY-like chemotaxis protein